ncbi:MAG: hypothetical protein NTV34_14515 [Proteobacteria bacterium]|nr:hypothetical protein [Pseudomonadota bacterium]
MEWVELLRHSADSALRSLMGMSPRFILLRRGLGRVRPLSTKAVPSASKTGLRAPAVLVKDRPVHFEERYAVANSAREIDEAFGCLRKKLFRECEAISSEARQSGSGRIILREQGTTSEGRLFLFFKPFSDFGWLIERSGAGWRVSRAEKIVSQQMFLRSHADPWDVVLMYQDPKGEGSQRVKSHRFGNTLMSLVVYEQKMSDAFSAELRGQVN